MLQRYLLSALITLSLASGLELAGQDQVVQELLAELHASIPADEIEEPGSLRWPEMVRAAVEQASELGLDADQSRDLALAAAEAWLAAQRPDAARQLLFSREEGNPSQKERYDLVLVHAWHLELAREPEQELDPEQALADYAAFSPVVQARAQSLAGQVALQRAAPEDLQLAQQYFDRAIALLADADASQRVPLLALRLLAMERAKIETAQIRAWMNEYMDDPAMQMIQDSALTDGQRLQGLEAPELRAQRRDGIDGVVDLQDFRGQTLLLFFSATWSQAAQALTPQVVALAREKSQHLAVIEVSLDTRDTLAALPAYRARFGIEHPIVAEGLGWDGELAQSWHIASLPSLIIVDQAGRIVHNDLVVYGDPAASIAQTRQVLQRLWAGQSDDAPSETSPASPDSP